MVRSHWLRVYAARLDALFRLAFTPAPGLQSLSLAAQRNSQVYSTKDTPQTHCARDILPVHGFRFYFTPLAGVLFAFPSRYFCAIGSRLVFSLGSWSTRIRTGFHVPRPTQVPHHGERSASRTGLSPSSVQLSGWFRCIRFASTPRVIPMRPYNPAKMRFGLLRVRSPLLAESLLICFPGLLRWFTSPSVAPPDYFIHPRGARLRRAGYPIRQSPDQRTCAPPRGLSQLIAAFIAMRLHRHPPCTYASLDHIAFPPSGT